MALYPDNPEMENANNQISVLDDRLVRIGNDGLLTDADKNKLMTEAYAERSSWFQELSRLRAEEYRQ